MDQNLNDWLGAHPWCWWVLLGVLCLGVELLERRRHAALLALAAGAAALSAVLAPRLFWVQAGVAAVVAVAALWLRRRLTGRTVARGRRTR